MLFRRLLKNLRQNSGITFREVEFCCGIGSSTLYNAEGKGEMMLSSYLRLFTLFLSAEGYEFNYRLLTESIEECIRTRQSIRLSFTGSDLSHEEGILLKPVR